MNPKGPPRIVPPLQFVTGKGGVGKSTFAAALALGAARAGFRVLAIEMGAPAGMAGLLGVRPPAHGVPVAVPDGAGLHLAYYDGEAALAEYLLQHLPLKRLWSAVFSHPLYHAFVSAGPGVRELMAIGKVRDELLGLSTGGPLWDLMVIDAGASGHARQLLRMPAATARAFSSGLAHREATRVVSSLSDPSSTAVHVVALPEEMPLEEAAEIIEQLNLDLRLPVGRLVINQCRPRAPAGADRVLRALTTDADGDGDASESPARRALAVAARQALGWLRLQEDGIAALERRAGMPAERLPRLTAEPFGRAEIDKLAGVAFRGSR
jgi:anion-transporting  ArsA/GET3 family ATPase